MITAGLATLAVVVFAIGRWGRRPPDVAALRIGDAEDRAHRERALRRGSRACQAVAVALLCCAALSVF
jgi:hypothetical protein